MFTARHYVAIAEVLRDERKYGMHSAVVDSVAESLADMFEADNTRFNRQKFMAATMRTA